MKKNVKEFSGFLKHEKSALHNSSGTWQKFGV